MAVLIVLIAATLTFRGIGALGVESLDSWQVAARYGLSAMLLFTASAHFTSMRHDLVRMAPSWVPKPEAMVFFTGICELIGAIGIQIPDMRQATGLALIALFIALL